MGYMKKNLVILTLIISFFSVHTAFGATTTKTSNSTASKSKSTTQKKKTTAPVKLDGVFYFIPGTSAYASIQKYGGKMSVISPQVYTVDGTGTLKGQLSDQMMALITEKKLNFLLQILMRQGMVIKTYAQKLRRFINKFRIFLIMTSLPF